MQRDFQEVSCPPIYKPIYGLVLNKRPDDPWIGNNRVTAFLKSELACEQSLEEKEAVFPTRVELPQACIRSCA